MRGHLVRIMKPGLRMLVHAGDPQKQGGALHLRRPFGLGERLAT